MTLSPADLSMKLCTIANKAQMIVFDDNKGTGNRKVPVPPEKAREPALTKDILKELGIVGLRIEAYSNGVSPGH